MTDTSRIELAARALRLIDLTDLGDACSSEVIDRLCDAAVGPHGSVAAVCVWPRFVEQARARLAGTGVRTATVINFPAGGEDTAGVVNEAQDVVQAGAEEIDMVWPFRAFLEGRMDLAREQIARVRETLPADLCLKVILETGCLPAGRIGEAADIAIAAGADFLKTSTGKVEVNATPEAAAILLDAIARSGRPVGFKAAGGIRTLDDAAAYLALADDIIGPQWATPNMFRIGASGLLAALTAVLETGTEG